MKQEGMYLRERIVLLLLLVALISGLSGFILAKQHLVALEDQRNRNLLLSREERSRFTPKIRERVLSSQKPPTEQIKKHSQLQLLVNYKSINTQKNKGKWEIAENTVSRLIRIDRSLQRLFVYENGRCIFCFKCSTAVTGKILSVNEDSNKPHDHVGVFSIQGKELNHYSRKYHVNMPYALQYWGGHYIHATKAISRLGRPASHGCVRLHPKDAKILFKFAQVGDVVEIR